MRSPRPIPYARRPSDGLNPQRVLDTSNHIIKHPAAQPFRFQKKMKLAICRNRIWRSDRFHSENFPLSIFTVKTCFLEGRLVSFHREKHQRFPMAKSAISFHFQEYHPLR